MPGVPEIETSAARGSNLLSHLFYQVLDLPNHEFLKSISSISISCMLQNISAVSLDQQLLFANKLQEAVDMHQKMEQHYIQIQPVRPAGQAACVSVQQVQTEEAAAAAAGAEQVTSHMMHMHTSPSATALLRGIFPAIVATRHLNRKTVSATAHMVAAAANTLVAMSVGSNFNSYKHQDYQEAVSTGTDGAASEPAAAAALVQMDFGYIGNLLLCVHDEECQIIQKAKKAKTKVSSHAMAEAEACTHAAVQFKDIEEASRPKSTYVKTAQPKKSAHLRTVTVDYNHRARIAGSVSPSIAFNNSASLSTSPQAAAAVSATVSAAAIIALSQHTEASPANMCKSKNNQQPGTTVTGGSAKLRTPNRAATSSEDEASWEQLRSAPPLASSPAFASSPPCRGKKRVRFNLSPTADSATATNASLDDDRACNVHAAADSAKPVTLAGVMTAAAAVAERRYGARAQARKRGHVLQRAAMA